MMPSTLTELEYNVGHYYPFISEDLPYSMRSLTLHVEKDYCPVFHKLPPCLRSLTLDVRNKILLLENDLPESITSLKITSSFPSLELKGEILPLNLQYLSLKCGILQMKTPLPRSLTFLDALSYFHWFDEGILPDSLTTLNLNKYYSKQYLHESSLPESLEFVNVGDAKIRVHHSL
jgi:FNIP Repeat